MTGWSFGSRVYGSAWSTPELRALFDDQPRTRRWLDMLAYSRRSRRDRADPGGGSAETVAACRIDRSLDDGLLRRVPGRLPGNRPFDGGADRGRAAPMPAAAGEWFYFGATVQDITDTWLMLALRDARGQLARRSRPGDGAAARLCRQHRDTVMPGRTHGQQGLPITFGFKVAGWLAEMRRHRQRFGETAARMGIGQLCGGVGSLSALGRGPRAAKRLLRQARAALLRPCRGRRAAT